MQNKSLSNFLFLIAAMVLIMAVIGAATRLTESGLSITYWKPISGAVPPITETDWLQEFDIYKASPQYQQVNRGMELSEFKTIFWWEWVHRQWGRLIGLVYAAGLGWFWLRGQIPQRYKPHMLGLLLLGAGQGVMGWYMVKSGLVNDPAVSHYRLAAHLGLAVVIYLCCIYFALEVRGEKGEGRGEKEAEKKISPLYKHSILTLCVVLLTVVWGAFTAGLDAGLIYNTWPLMGDSFVPPEIWHLSPWWINFFENHPVVQFMHRMLAYLCTLMAVGIGFIAWRRGVPMAAAKWAYGVSATGLLQMTLGIVTVLTGVHIHVAVTHQFGAFVLMGLLVVWISRLRLYRRP